MPDELTCCKRQQKSENLNLDSSISSTKTQLIHIGQIHNIAKKVFSNLKVTPKSLDFRHGEMKKHRFL